MKTIDNFIYEKLKLNSQSRLLNKDVLNYQQWENKITKEFNLDTHRLSNSWVTNNIYNAIKAKYKTWRKLKFIHLNSIPEHCKNICEDIIDHKEVKETTILYENNPYYNEVNIYHIYYYNSMHIILIIRFKESPAREKYDAYEVYEID